MATPMLGVTEDLPPQQQQQQPSPQSLPNPPRDHVAPKSYESVTIAVGRNCPPALRRNAWNVTDFDLRKLMYNGAISMVYHAVDKRSGITVALKLYKRIKLNEIERHQVAREIRLHSDLVHDSIIALYAAWKDRAYVYLVLEWAPGGDVYSYLKSQRGRLAEELAVPLILEPFMAGLAVIHERGLIHRDIKPENMLLTNSFQVKIADFGLSIDSKQEIANTRLGTIDYLAPEILNCPVKHHPEDHKDRPDTGYTNKVDCWSVGVLAYELLVGQPPFAAPSANETLKLIRTKKVEYPHFLSPESVNFMSVVLVRDPSLRPSIAELLQHPWILKYSRREGGGLARGRNRAQQRRPTMDGGMLVRSITTDLAPAHAIQKQLHLTPQLQPLPQQQPQQQPQQPLQPLQPFAAQPGAPSTSTGYADSTSSGGAVPVSVNGNSFAGAKHVLHHSNTYGHGQGLSNAYGHSLPMTPLSVNAAAAAAAGGGGSVGGNGAAGHPTSGPVPGLNLSAIATAPVTYDTAMAAAGNGGGGGSAGTPATVPSGFASMSVTPMVADGQQQQQAHHQQLPLPPAPQPAPGLAASSPDRSVAAFSRKLKFWSVTPSMSSGGAPAAGSNGPPPPNDGPTPMAWEAAPASPNAGAGGTRVAALPPVTNANGAQVVSGSPGGSPSLFSRLTSGRPRSGAGSPAGAGGSPLSPGSAAAAGGVGVTAFLTSPIVGGKNGALENGAAAGEAGSGCGPAGGVAGMSVYPGSAAVPPVNADPPASPSGMFRKGSSFLRPAA